MLGLRLDPRFGSGAQRLNAVISDLQGLGASGETYIVGDDLLMRSDSRFASESTILRTKVDSKAVRESLAGRSGSAIINDYRGVEVLSLYRPLQVAGLNWVLIAEVDRQDLMAPANRLVWEMVIVIAVALALIACVSWVALNLCVQRPLKQLADAADQVIAGDYTARVNVASSDEFALLAACHNRMVGSVQDHVTQLERALAEVHQLLGLLPICGWCKSIRGDDGYFRTVETYLVGKSNLEFSHTVCHDCMLRLYPELHAEGAAGGDTSSGRFFDRGRPPGSEPR